MPAGRPPKPTKLKILSGNPGKRPLNDREPSPEIEAPRRPSWIVGRAKAEWERIVPILLSLGLLTRLDLAALAGYCQAFAELERATKEIEKHGILIDREYFDRHGESLGERKVVNPAVALQRDAFARVKSYLSEFGLSPSSRSRVKGCGAGKEADPFEDFLSGQGKTKTA